MKTVLSALFFGLVFAVSAHAAPAAIKTCDAHVQYGDTPSEIIVRVFKNASGYSAESNTIVNGQSTENTSAVTISEFAVRAGLSADSDSAPGDLNGGEAFIWQAMVYEQTPGLGQGLDLGFDLQAVRAVRVYMIGTPTNMGAAAIVESYDQDGNLLGSFFGGLLLGACQ